MTGLPKPKNQKMEPLQVSMNTAAPQCWIMSLKIVIAITSWGRSIGELAVIAYEKKKLHADTNRPNRWQCPYK